MRTKLLLLLALSMFPISMVGCDSSEVQVGTGDKQPPPEVQERIKKEEEMRKKMMEDQQANPTPAPSGN